MVNALVSIGVVRTEIVAVSTVCTLLGRYKFEVAPEEGDVFSFAEKSGEQLAFRISTPDGVVDAEAVLLEVESVRADSIGVAFGGRNEIYVYGYEIEVPTLDDARRLCHFMSQQYGFEIDRYSINVLEEEF